MVLVNKKTVNNTGLGFHSGSDGKKKKKKSACNAGFPSAPGLSACLMHPTWAGDLFHPR